MGRMSESRKGRIVLGAWRLPSGARLNTWALPLVGGLYEIQCAEQRSRRQRTWERRRQDALYIERVVFPAMQRRLFASIVEQALNNRQDREWR